MTDTSAKVEFALTSPKLAAAHAVWAGLKGAHVGPKRDAITPALLRGATAWTYVVDVVDGTDFRFRFAGDRLTQFMGRRLTGIALSTLRGQPFFEKMHELYSGCVTARRPIAIGPLPSTYPGKEFLEIEAMVLPLSEDGRAVTALFGGLDSWQLGTHAATR